MNPKLKAGIAKFWIIPVMALLVMTVALNRTPSAQAQTSASPAATAAPRSTPAEPAAAPTPRNVETERYSLDEMDAKSGSAEVPSMGATLLKLVVILLLLFALLVGGLVVFQRVARRGLNLGGGKRPLHLVDKLAISPKQSVCLIRTCGRYMVLGVTEKEINVLMEASPEEAGDDKGFTSVLEQAVGPQTLHKAE